MLPLISHLLCLFVIWPALVARFDAPRRPARRPIARQWRACAVCGGRLYALRVQLVIA